MDDDCRIVGFEEKPQDPKHIPGRPDLAFASMGIYLFNTKTLLEYLKSDALQDTSHDFGKNIIPQMMKTARVCAYNFKDENKKEAKYWRDVGTIDAYWEANMDLVSVDPLLTSMTRPGPSAPTRRRTRRPSSCSPRRKKAAGSASRSTRSWRTDAS